MCAHYDRLKNIFGEKYESEMELFDSSQSSTDFFGFENIDDYTEMQPSGSTPSLHTPMHISPELDSNSLVQNSSDHTQQNPESGRTEKVSAFAEKLKKSAKDSISQLTKCQSDRNETQRLKLEFEEKKFLKEFEFQKQRFEAEIEIKRQELDLRKKEIEKDMNLKKLELEKDERIAKYELDLKYRN